MKERIRKNDRWTVVRRDSLSVPCGVDSVNRIPVSGQGWRRLFRYRLVVLHKLYIIQPHIYRCKKEDVEMLEFASLPKVDVFNYTIEDLEKIVKWELIEIRSEIKYILGDVGCFFFIGYSQGKIRQMLYYNTLNWFIKPESERPIRYLDTTTLKYSTPYLQE